MKKHWPSEKKLLLADQYIFSMHYTIELLSSSDSIYRQHILQFVLIVFQDEGKLIQVNYICVCNFLCVNREHYSFWK